MGDLLGGDVGGDHGNPAGLLADAASKWTVDVSTIITIRRTVKDAALAALSRRPGRPGKERNWPLEQARTEIAQLTEAIKAQAIELSIVRGKSGWD